MAVKNLGTLTIDLVAKVGGFVQGMDKAERSSSKWRKQVEKDAKMVGTAVGAAAAAVVAGLSAMTVATVRQASEISKFAALSGTANESFQRYAAGAKALGVEQEKLADIFKDTQDKVGDFLQTGGGALADFFENIAPKVGVTAEQFRKLSGPEALGLYVSSLEKAGVSQSEMVFYMEAIASDATLLLPLLRNNSEGFRQLGDAAAAAGAIMDDSLIRSSLELQAATVLADQAFAGMRNQIMQGMMPVLADLADEMFSVATNTGIAEEAGVTFGYVIKGAAATAMGAYAAFQLLGKSMAAIAAGAADLSLETLSIGFDDVTKSAEEYGKVIEGIWAAGEEEAKKTGGRVKELADLLEQSQKTSVRTGATFEKVESKKAAAVKTARDAVADQISAIERAAKVWGMTADEVQIYDLRLKGASETQIKYAEGLLKSVSAMEQQKKSLEEIGTLRASLDDSLNAERQQGKDELAGIGLSDKAEQRLKAQRSLIADYQKQISDAARDRAKGDISQDAYVQQLAMYKDHLDERLELQAEYYGALDDMQGSWQDGASKALANYAEEARDVYGQTAELIGDTMSTLTDGIASSMTDAILYGEDLRTSLAALADTITESVLNSLIEMGIQYGVNAALEAAGIATVSAAKIAATSAETAVDIASTTSVATAETAAAGTVAAAKIAAITATTAASTVATTTTTATQTAAAATTAAAWTPAAIVSSIGSFGTAAAIGLAAVVAALAFTGGFRKGGYTGGGGVDDVAGVVHGQEYVFDAEATKRIGVANLEAIRAGRTTANSGGVAFAEVSGATSTERYNGRRDGVSVTQNITTQGRIDRRTSNQLATDSARKTRIAQSRLA